MRKLSDFRIDSIALSLDGRSPPGPLSPKRGEGEKIAGFSFDFKGVRILD
jgi:hypothetical protein